MRHSSFVTLTILALASAPVCLKAEPNAPLVAKADAPVPAKAPAPASRLPTGTSGPNTARAALPD